MITADDLLAARTRQANRGEMIAWIHQVSARWFGGEVARRDRRGEALVVADQQPAAFKRRGGASVPDHGFCDAVWKNHTSITMAMPIPPPMQSPATPRPPPRFRSA